MTGAALLLFVVVAAQQAGASMLDTDVNGTLFAEAGGWVAVCRFLLFPLIGLRRRLPEDTEGRTGRRYIPKEATHGIILLATAAAFFAIGYWQEIPLREAIPAGGMAVAFAIAAYDTEQAARERRMRGPDGT